MLCINSVLPLKVRFLVFHTAKLLLILSIFFFQCSDILQLPPTGIPSTISGPMVNCTSKRRGKFCWKIRYFVFHTFSLEPEAVPNFFSKSNAVYIMSKCFKIMVVSSAYCVSLYSIHSPSIDFVWIPSIESESRMACAIGSACMMYNKADNESPCRMPLFTGKYLEITPFVIIALWAYLYNILIQY